MAWAEQPLFDGWAPELTRPPALWATVDDSVAGLDEQARWIWPDAVGSDGTNGARLWNENEQGALWGRSQGWSS